MTFNFGHRKSWIGFKSNVSSSFIFVNVINDCTLQCNIVNKEKQGGMQQKNIWCEDIYLVPGSTLDLNKLTGN